MLEDILKPLEQLFKTGWGHPNNQGILVYILLWSGQSQSIKHFNHISLYLKEKVIKNIFYSIFNRWGAIYTFRVELKHTYSMQMHKIKIKK